MLSHNLELLTTKDRLAYLTRLTAALVKPWPRQSEQYYKAISQYQRARFKLHFLENCPTAPTSHH